MISAAERTGCRLLPMLNRVDMPSVEQLGSLIRGGRIGEPFLIESHGVESSVLLDQIGWLRTDPLAGVLRSHAVHPAYVLRGSSVK
jgi:predicted dehydrogenase